MQMILLCAIFNVYVLPFGAITDDHDD